MKDIEIVMEKEVQFKDPVLIEGLPGVGNVGKIAVEHLIETLDAEHFATIYSVYLPPQVLVEKGVASMVSHKLYYHPRKKGDLIFLTGEYQAINTTGQYRMADAIIKLAVKWGVKWIYTLGGYGIGHFVPEPRVLGAVNDPALIEGLLDKGIHFEEAEPGSGIVGASGLLIGIGALHSIPGLCLMGETMGYIVDPNSARAVLEVLLKILDLDVSLEDLQRKALEVERITSKLKEYSEMMESTEEMGYIR